MILGGQDIVRAIKSEDLINQSRKNSVVASRRVSEATTLTTTTTASRSLATSFEMQSTKSSLGTDNGTGRSRRESLGTSDLHNRRRSDGMVKSRVSIKKLDGSSQSSVTKSSTTTSGNTLDHQSYGRLGGTREESTTTKSSTSNADAASGGEDWEEEAEDLIDWTAGLKEDEAQPQT